MRIAVFAVPYDAGRRSVGVGLGPARLLEVGLARQLRDAGHDVREATIELPLDTASHELARTAAVQRELGHAVHTAVENEELPIVLAGNCSTAVGTLAARPASAGVVWFDAHADFNTAETTTTGMLDGLALSMVTGRALRNLTAGVRGFIPVAMDRVLLIGARDLDPPEESALAFSDVRRVSASSSTSEIGGALRALGQPAPPVYVHLDLDVLDPSHARANQYAAAGGLAPDMLLATLKELIEVSPLYAVAITAYDPAFDTSGTTARIAMQALNTLVPRPDGGE